MDDMNDPQGGSQGLPAGYTVDSTPTPASPAATPQPPPPATAGGLPAGYTVDSSPQPDPSGTIHMDSDKDGLYKTYLKGVSAVGAGIGDGLLGGLNGAADLLHIPHQLLKDRQKELEYDNRENPGLNATGYAGETLAEFMGGDELLKGLGFADRMAKIAKTAKVLEGSPRLMKALQIGAHVMTVQGAQTLIRTQAQPGESYLDTLEHKGVEATKDAAIGGVTGGALGYAGSLASDGVTKLLSRAGDIASKAGDISDVANNAMSKEEIRNQLSSHIDQAENDLHSQYQSGMNDFADRIGDEKIDYEDSPLHKAAQGLQNLGQDTSQPLDAAFSKSRPGSPKFNNMVDMLAEKDGQLPEPEGEEAGPQTSSILGPDGNPLPASGAADAAEEPEPVQLGIKELIERRQQLGEMLRNTGYMSDEGRATKNGLRTLIGAVDDTIGKLADQAGDPTLTQDYADLRNTYRERVGLFDEPLIKNLQEGKMDEAAKALIGTVRQGSALPAAGKFSYNGDLLRRVIGNENYSTFGKTVFDSMLKDASDNGQFNPSKFVDTWKRINTETKGDLFGLNPDGSAQTLQPEVIEKNNQDIARIAKDAKSAANLQRLIRVGLLSTGIAGAVVHPAMSGVGLVSLLAFTSERGGVHNARELLDFVANHPKTWRVIESAGEAATRAVPKLSTATNAVAKGAGFLTGGSPYASAHSALSGN